MNDHKIGDVIETSPRGKGIIEDISFDGYVTVRFTRDGSSVRMKESVVDSWRRGTHGLGKAHRPKRSGKVSKAKP